MKISIGVSPLNSNADIILHPIKYEDSITYEPLAEEAVLALLAKELVYDYVNKNVKQFFDEMDDGYLFSESNFDTFDIDNIKHSISDLNNELIIGRDILLHPRKKNILKIVNLFRLIGFNVNEYIDSYSLDEIEELETFDGSVVYIEKGNNNKLLISPQFKLANKITTNKIFVDKKEKEVIIENNLKGVFGIVFEDYDKYPFKRVQIN